MCGVRAAVIFWTHDTFGNRQIVEDKP